MYVKTFIDCKISCKTTKCANDGRCIFNKRACKVKCGKPNPI